MTLTEFLLARIADDEAAANDPEWLAFEYGVDSGGRAAFSRRVLAECEAKRLLVEDCQRSEDALRSRREPTTAAIDGHVLARRETLRIIAAIYADHDDYDEGWRP